MAFRRANHEGPPLEGAGEAAGGVAPARAGGL